MEKQTSNEDSPLSTQEVPIAHSPPLGCKLEYKSVLEYREINRHTRRKIEAWLEDGWYISWEWNGLHDYQKRDSRFDDDNPYGSAHWMTLRRSKAKISPLTSRKRKALKFPKTPNPPPDPNPHPYHPAVYSDNESDSDSE